MWSKCMELKQNLWAITAEVLEMDGSKKASDVLSINGNIWKLLVSKSIEIVDLHSWSFKVNDVWILKKWLTWDKSQVQYWAFSVPWPKSIRISKSSSFRTSAALASSTCSGSPFVSRAISGEPSVGLNLTVTLLGLIGDGLSKGAYPTAQRLCRS